MPTLNKNYITDKFKLPGTDTLVILNGIHQPGLSDTKLNSMFKNQTLHIPGNSKIAKPIHLLFLGSEDYQCSLNIIAKKSSYTTIIEEYASLGSRTYTNNIQTNINAETSSEIVHYKLQTENIGQANHQINTYINQEKNSKISSTLINKGAKIAKDMLHINLKGENANYSIKGINLSRDTQTMSHQIRIEHLVPNCTSNVLLKSIVNDHAIDNFDCRVIAHPGAFKTETHVVNKNLLLAETATANSAPELEIYVDDVICTHSATVGQLDAEALFYLRSRGITKNAAIKLLTDAFAEEITTNFAKYNRFEIFMDRSYE